MHGLRKTWVGNRNQLSIVGGHETELIRVQTYAISALKQEFLKV